MGQKVSPIGMRVGVIRDWESKWFAEKDYADYLLEDNKIRTLITTKCKSCAISKVEIERSKNHVSLTIRTALPGRLVGEDSPLNAIKPQIAKIAKGKEVEYKVLEVANPDLDARLVAQKIAKGLEERQSFRTVQKKAIQSTMRAGAKGIKTSVSGRLGGADIARAEGYSEGIVPLHTLRSDIDYAWEEAMTTYGKLGVKVWICRGEVLPGKMVEEPVKKDDNRGFRRRPANRRPVRRAPATAENKEGE